MLSVVKNSSFLKPSFLCSSLNKFQIKNFRLGQAGEFLELPVTIEAQTIEIFIVHYVMGPCFKARLLYSVYSNKIICASLLNKSHLFYSETYFSNLFIYFQLRSKSTAVRNYRAKISTSAW